MQSVLTDALILTRKLSKFLMAFILVSLFIESSQAQAQRSFFEGIDSAVSSHSQRPLNGRALVAYRFQVVFGRISIFAMYCDSSNLEGLNSAFSSQLRLMNSLKVESDRLLGGERAVFNIFEDIRNDESLRFTQMRNSINVCAQDRAVFNRLVRMSVGEMSSFLNSPE